MTSTTGTTDSRSTPTDTPAASTDALAEIRASIHADIEPSTGFWQFELRPWHYAVSIASTAVMFAAVVVLLAIHGGVR